MPLLVYLGLDDLSLNSQMVINKLSVLCNVCLFFY